MTPITKLAACLVILFLTATGLNSCFQHYYKTNTVATTDEKSIQDLISAQKYFILHSGSQAYAISHLKVSDNMVEGDLTNLPEAHEKFLNPKRPEGNKFKLRYKEVVLYEVHLYTQDSVLNGTHVRVPIKDIVRLDAYNTDKSATTGSTVISIVGITLGAALIVTVIAAAATENVVTNSAAASSSSNVSCSPKVYLLDKDSRQLTGVLYSGAIFAPLQRTDYLPLPSARPVDGHLQLQVQTAENEELYIHDVSLLRVTHRSGENVLADRGGKLWTFRRPQAPYRASIGDGKDIKATVAADDDRCYSFTNRPEGQPNSDIILDFKKPVGAGSGRLVVKARNSVWGAYVFKGFKALYGEYYPALLQLKDKGDREKLLQCELDQSMPLSVSVQQAGDWHPADFFYTTGNDAPRYMIMNIDLTGHENEDHVSIRLRTAFQFWDLDYAGMDFSENRPADTELIASNTTTTHITDKDTLKLDFATATTAHATRPGYTDSWFLVGTGYYHDNSRFAGKPQLDKLAGFSSKGAFDKFSRQQFDELMAAIRTHSKKDVSTNN